MIDDQNPVDGIDPNRFISRARAALREAAEHLEDAAMASDHSSVSVASALSHVTAARKTLGPYGSAENGRTSEQEAA